MLHQLTKLMQLALSHQLLKTLALKSLQEHCPNSSNAAVSPACAMRTRY
jgi:hypothetical protein